MHPQTDRGKKGENEQDYLKKALALLNKVLAEDRELWLWEVLERWRNFRKG